MLKTVEGIYRDGKVELCEPAPVAEGSRVLVTVLEDAPVDLETLGVSEEAAADLRWRLQSVAQDWERPEMAVYDAL